MTDDAGARLGGLIAGWRRDAGLSQADLADSLHTQQATISKMESGTYRVGALQLLEILDACGLRITDVAEEVQGELGTEPRPLWERIDE